MFGLPARESVFFFFGLWALLAIFAIPYAVRVQHAPLRGSVNIFVLFASTLVLGGSIFTKTFSSHVVGTIDAILLAVTFRNWLPRIKRMEPERRRRRDTIKAKLLRVFRMH